jgi:hypothetical protein
MCDVCVSSLQRKTKWRRGTTSASKKSALRYRPNPTNLALLVAHVLGVMFQLHLSNGRRDRHKKLLWPPTKSALRYWPISTELALSVAHAWWVLNLTFELHQSNGRRGREEKLLWPPSKVSSITDWFWPNVLFVVHVCWMLDVPFQLHQSNGKRDRDKKLLHSTTKVPLVHFLLNKTVTLKMVTVCSAQMAAMQSKNQKVTNGICK